LDNKHRQVGISSVKQALLGLLFAVTVFGGPAMAVEEPAYTVVLHENEFELRDYPKLVVAEVKVAGGRNSAAYKGFRLLAGYIFGGNTRRQDIAMTAPVIQTPSQIFPMTAPVVQTEADGAWIIRFTMPSRYALEALPKPDNPEVRLTVAPATRMAVIRFSGLIHEGVVAVKSQALTAFIKAQKLRAVGPPSLAQYDPPWTLWFLRRNEIMIPVDAAT
jgi:hypothetical protein